MLLNNPLINADIDDEITIAAYESRIQSLLCQQIS